MTTPAYPINVFWSSEDEAWVADAPDLPYCSALGDTPHEAVAEVEVAIEAWVEAATSSGRAVPQPSVRIAQAWPLPARSASFTSGPVVKRRPD